MTKYTSLASIVIFGIALSACGEQTNTGVGPGDAGGSSPAGDAAATAPGGIDHAQDIREFDLKRSLSGVESLIEDLEAKGADTSDLETKKKELEQQLAAFQSG